VVHTVVFSLSDDHNNPLSCVSQTHLRNKASYHMSRGLSLVAPVPGHSCHLSVLARTVVVLFSTMSLSHTSGS
jgi:hypothetical protein